MAECNWKPELHGGKPCPKHGNAGQGSNHQVRISGGKYQTRIGGDDGDWEDISKEEFDELKDGGYEEFDATVDDDFGFDEEETEEDEEVEEMVDVPYHDGLKGKVVDRKGGMVTVEYTTPQGITRRDQFYEDELKQDRKDLDRGLRAAEEIEAATPKEPQLRGRWKDEVITDKNRESFLNESGISDRFYWDGADLVDKKSGDEVYSLPRGGAQASHVWDSVFGGEKNATEEKPVEKPDEDFTFELNRVGKQLREVGFNLTTNEEVANSYKKKPDEYAVEERTNPEGKKFWTIDRKTKLAKGQRRRTKDGGFEIRRSPDDEWQQVTEEEYNDVAYEDYKEPFKKKNTSGGK